MIAVQNEISATIPNPYITVDRLAALKGQSVSYTRKTFTLIKILAGLAKNSHQVHVDILILHAQSIPALRGLKKEDFLSIN